MLEEATGTRVQRRKQLARQRLVDAGHRLIGSHGVEGLRISDITDEADVALGSFYSHFPSKTELVEAVVEQALTEIATTLAGTGDTEDTDDAAVVTSIATRRVVRLAFDAPEFARVVANLDRADSLFVHAFSPVAVEVVQRGIDAGRFRVDDVGVAVNLVVGSSLSLIRAVLEGLHPEGVEETHAELCLRSLGIEPSEAATIAHLPLPG
jgi:AcrR family transcriptional regulator